MLSPEPVIDAARRAAGLRLFVVEAAFANATAALTTGVILTAFALHLGAGNAMVGLLASLPFLTQLAQLPTVWLVERLRTRKRIAVLSSIVGRSMLGVMALLPFLATGTLPTLLWATLVLCTMAAIGGCAWNAWVRDLAPEERMGELLSRRTVYATMTTLLVGIAAAAGLEFSAPGSTARDATFALLYGAGCILGLASAAIAARIPEPAMPAADPAGLDLAALVRRPLGDANFRRLLTFIAAWQFAVNFATPFFTIFLVRQLGYSMTIVMGLSVASQLANALTLHNWGRLSDRFSNKSVLLVAAPLSIACIIAMIGGSQIDAPVSRLAWLVVLHLVMGAAMGGATLAVTNIALRLSPRGEATAYVAVNGLVSALAAGTAPILGGLLADFFAARRLELGLRWVNPGGATSIVDLVLSSWDFYFLIAGLIGIYALHRLSLVREEGEVERSAMIRHLVDQTRSSIHNLSTVTGLRAITVLPAGLLRDARVRARWRRLRGRPKTEGPEPFRGQRRSLAARNRELSP